MTSIAGLRYVKPLFELAREESILDEVCDDLQAFAQLLKESRDLEAILLNPQISARQKKQIILKLTEEGTTPLVRDFFCLLVDKGRERFFPYLAKEFEKLLQESKNQVSATVQSPVPLREELKQKLSERFEALTGKTVELVEELKPDLIAGVRILMGSRMLDGSLKARLEGIRRHLKQSGAGKTG
jgi:F-type H+-transporting ATPase subunit delta